MPKFFVCSDIHSFYTPLKKALDESGFNPDNEDHWLISCGDCFDRGDESEDLLHFLMGIERKILVKGNHDILLDELVFRGFPYSHDKSNGTVRTVMELGGSYLPRDFAACCEKTYNRLARYRELLVNYFETKNYIFVHSWIPTSSKEVNHEAEKRTTWNAAYQYLVMTSIGTAAIMIAFFLTTTHSEGFSFAQMANNTLAGGMLHATFAAAFIGFALKAGLVPLHVWLPNAHPAAPSHVSALMSGVMLKIALYGFGRFMFNFLPEWNYWWEVIVIFITVLSISAFITIKRFYYD